MENKKKELTDIFSRLLSVLENEPVRDGLKKTPERMADFYLQILENRRTNIDEILEKSIFQENYDEMIVLKDIEYYSLCEHHLLPFFGKAHIAYIPRGNLIGISSIAKALEYYSNMLQIQERLTKQVADCLHKALQPLGIAVILEGYHLCMMMRGVKKENAHLITSAMYGSFRKSTSTRMEFLEFYNRITKK
jgi:GTP cyclohydrolase I